MTLTEGLYTWWAISGALCWRLGGAGEPPFHKGWRRVVLPVVSGVVLLAVFPVWWRTILAVLVMAGVNWLGYGEKHPLWLRGVIAASLGLPAVVLNGGVWWAPLVTLGVFGGLYAASRRWNWVWWGLVELAAGLTQVGVMIFAVQHP